VELYKNYDCKLQIGGSDQYGNGTTGTELIRKMLGKDDACILTRPLVTKADGTKFGKSEKGNIWLDPEKTSPYEFYQFWLNQSDEDSERFIKLFTLIPLDNIKTLVAQHRENPSKRQLQILLAEYMTEMIHGRDALHGVKQATDFLFGGIDIKDVDENGWKFVKSEVTTVEMPKEQLASGVTVIDLAAMHDKVTSKSEARKLVRANGFSINKEKVTDDKAVFDCGNLINDKYLLLQKGKKDYTLVVAS
jgi:tyrosyl-tRNA synthetase